MWLLVDIGNSAVKVGLFDPTSAGLSGLERTLRLEPSMAVESELRHWLDGAQITRVGAVSVVPAQTERWRRAIDQLDLPSVEFFNATSRLPFDLKYKTPTTLGNDRIAVAAGGWLRFGKPRNSGVIVIDAGTAVNYEVVTAEGAYLGGVIGPGPGLMRQALGQGTAQLPSVELERPISRIGTSTDEAIRSGIMFGLRDAVFAMEEGIKKEVGGPFEVVLTGGWGSWLSHELSIHYEPELVLKGIAELMRFSAE